MLSGGRRWVCAAAVIAVPLLPIPSAAQGAITGRIAINEKPGEKTTDFASGVVYLTAKSGSPRFTESKVQMAMNGRNFSPRVRTVTVGSTVEYPNQDPFKHNIFSTAAGASFDLGEYGSGTKGVNKFTKAGAFPVYCNIHAKMTGFVVVVSTPWFAQASADGRWEIARVPAGKYELHAWHERGGEQVQQIDVPATGLAMADLAFDARGFKEQPHKNKFGKDYANAGVVY